MTPDHIKTRITAYGIACARTARAPRLSPSQDEALRLERVAHDALVAAVGEWKSVLIESRDLFAVYAESHRVRGPDHAAKAARNEEMSAKINAALGKGS